MLELEKIVLKNILLKQINEAEEGSEETEKDKTPFEKDPMNFILSKYVTLNDTLSELMTPSFKEYLNAIFIVAPKPTTFKILLHNGQIFFLTYLGKAYQATIEGKDYYLMTIGEKERCMQAISRLLRYGSPLKTKGPEGAEQGTRPEGEEGGGETEAPAPAPEGGEAGGEETVSENIILENILKKSLAEVKADLLNTIKNELSAQGYQGKRDSKHGAHLRYQIGTEEETLKVVNSILNNIDSSKYYKIETIQPEEFAKGARSGKYPTYKVTITKNVGDFKKGEEVFIVNQQTEKATVTKKSLTPKNLGIIGKVYRNHSELSSALKSSVSKLKDKKLSELLISLTDLVDSQVRSRFKSIADLEGYEESIPFDKKTTDLMPQFSQEDINSIGVDYGEELGALALLKSIKSPEVGVEFPKGNNPLADFTLDGYNISSKYSKGASATLTAIINGIDRSQLTNKSQKSLYELLRVVVSNNVPQGYIEVAKGLKSPAINTLASILKLDPSDLTAQDINDYIVRLTKNAKTSEEKSNLVMKKFAPFYNEIKRKPQNGKIDFDKFKRGAADYYGAILGPLSYYVADQMNANPKFAAALTELLSKVEVKQLYLVFSMNKKLINLKLKSFTDPNSKFKFDIGSQSVYNPANSRLAFKLL